eukprot:MONOS_13964.1-p1 / transcript=MONOS_13964.1 / gene=MONOS_13964 / organism=Monocercomonoides_exilis_PA203 / gene_product=Zinc-finger of C2H2 type containing protein / transcript_product=Zinc-finger of C2H2 type containing protein / location=Mono_scaffold00912:21259-22628(+) / protein_length=221 / sequence_SO=supercontig / SO=protein_coding / is_pseudo=false
MAIAQSFRRTFNKEDYAIKKEVEERKKQILQGGKPKREKSPVRKGTEFLKMRDTEVDITSNIGKSTFVTANMEKSQTGGYWCELCQCLLKDSTSWLDHINGTRHQAKMGMSMQVEKASFDDVKAKLEALDKETMKIKKKTSEEAKAAEKIVSEWRSQKEKIKLKDLNPEHEKNLEKRKKTDHTDAFEDKQKKEDEIEQLNEEEEEMLAMGFPLSVGSTKR